MGSLVPIGNKNSFFYFEKRLTLLAYQNAVVTIVISQFNRKLQRQRCKKIVWSVFRIKIILL
jgi:hypothetical protein